MWVSKITKENLTNDMIDRLLFEGLHDNGASVDCIIVLGSVKAAKYRVPAAAEAFFAGRSERIMLCGGKTRDFSGESMTEAENMCEKALELGVPETSIIMEKNSLNTIENIICSLLELQRSMWLNKVKSVLLVTTTYHMRRSLCIAKYLFPSHISVYPCPADDTTTKRNNWMNTPAGISRVNEEILNIVRCVHNGVIPDFEI
ncbi:MAG: YdcF family protein [Oscillospiraceae bacterium]|nr:YdcF family protein [Oscillospiraceae bacterium]